MNGRIIKGIGGFYSVMLPDQSIVVCKARGRFRRERLTPMIGDLVEIALQPDGYASIDRLLPRKSELVRPPVANIDQLVIVIAASHPQPDLLLVDKLLLQCSLMGIRPVIALNKLDEKSDAIEQSFLSDYKSFALLRLSTVTGEGFTELNALLQSRVSCLAGQSAVGKTSILNVLMPKLSLEIGALSERTERGRHTTRHAELWPYAGGAVLDTPGFSLLELSEVTQAQLDEAYPEFGDAPQRCRFAACAHVSEPDCAVKPLLAQGMLSRGRYERYKEIHHEIMLRRKTRYD